MSLTDAAQAAPDDLFHYFGYGSLVNAATRPQSLEVIPARLHGYRRAWRVSTRRSLLSGACSLTIVEGEASDVVRGVLARESRVSLPTLDRRERHYDRLTVGRGKVEPETETPHPGEAYVYRVKRAHDRFGTRRFPVLLSYVDCVIQGYLKVFGEEGVAEFMATTDGWHVPILDDRATPLYPRAQTLSDRERTLVDDALATAGASRFKR
ncbi:gamma-glutamylcyclotransferase family protein [Amorphus coralli]|uniref:gamma-glutamylcyclotransferase family protein n=1 Tax=Amorphus coralli TaxID=340680 RepID=UPI000368A313|nr:gamma-glutamylcyclotransferase family protein [Amorphus coralli]